MGRPRTPTKLLDARGAFKKDPQRRRDGEPQVKNPLGAPPEHLTEDEVKCWQEIAGKAPVGVLTEADGLAVEMASQLLARMRRSFDDMTAQDRKHLDVLLGRFGMNPSDRAKLSIEKPKDENPFAALDQ